MRLAQPKQETPERHQGSAVYCVRGDGRRERQPVAHRLSPDEARAKARQLDRAYPNHTFVAVD